MWAGEDSNLRPTDYESAALPTELPARASDYGRSRSGARDTGADGGGEPRAWCGASTRRWTTAMSRRFRAARGSRSGLGPRPPGSARVAGAWGIGRTLVPVSLSDRAEMFGEIRTEVERVWDLGDRVLAFLHVTGSGSGLSGAGSRHPDRPPVDGARRRPRPRRGLRRPPGGRSAAAGGQRVAAGRAAVRRPGRRRRRARRR